MAANVSIVLAHGAWADGSSWARVITALKAEGVNASAAPLPLTSVANDAAALKRSRGKNAPFFLPVGAEAFKRDNPGADVRFFNTGHFALETHAPEIAGAMREFLARGPG